MKNKDLSFALARKKVCFANWILYVSRTLNQSPCTFKSKKKIKEEASLYKINKFSSSCFFYYISQ